MRAAGGARVARIETSAVLTEALALYRSTGWVEVPALNAEPFADHWFEKTLAYGGDLREPQPLRDAEQATP